MPLDVYFVISIYLKAPVQSGIYGSSSNESALRNSLLASSGPFSTHLPQLPPTQSSLSSAVCPPDFLPTRLFLFELIPGLLFLCLLSNPSSSPRLCLLFSSLCSLFLGISPTHLTTFTALSTLLCCFLHLHIPSFSLSFSSFETPLSYYFSSSTFFSLHIGPTVPSAP